ncbi:intimin C-type lectin domain-containing protein, partial [Escherichia coli]
TPKDMITADITKPAIYSIAFKQCQTKNGRLPSSQRELENVFNLWGAANNYRYYSAKRSITAWIQQSGSDSSGGVTTTYDLIKKNPRQNVAVKSQNVYSVC